MQNKICYIDKLNELIKNDSDEHMKQAIIDDSCFFEDRNYTDEELEIKIKTIISRSNFNTKNYREYVDLSQKFHKCLSQHICDIVNFDLVLNYEEPVQIFISHSSACDGIAELFRELLLNHGVNRHNIIMEHASDYLEFNPGDLYLKEIKKHIETSEVFVSIMDDKFLESQMCNIELGMAFAYDLLIMPVYTTIAARDSDKVYKTSSHIETLDGIRYLEKMLRLMGCTPDSDCIVDFLKKYTMITRNT